MKNPFLILMLLIFPVSAIAQKQSCECTGQSKAIIYSGGDKSPLTFYSLERLLQPGTAQSDPVHCYERNVENHSDRDVTDVLWGVAAYYRYLLPSKQPICDSTAILGHLAQPNPQGLLNYGIGPAAYQTTVYAPSGGWSLKTKQTAFTGRLSPPDLESSIQVATRSGVSTLRFRSSVEDKVERRLFHFQITNEGKEEYRVFWNIPVTSDFRVLEMSPQSPQLVGQKAWSHDAQSRDPLAWIVAPVVVFGRDGKKIAEGVASAYCSGYGEVLRVER